MKEVVLDMNLKRMVGEFIDCVDFISYNQEMLASGDDECREFAKRVIEWSHKETEAVVKSAFGDDSGVGVFGMAYLACCLAANVSNVMFEAEAAASMKEE